MMVNAWKSLAAGVTLTIRMTGSEGTLALAIREAINRGDWCWAACVRRMGGVTLMTAGHGSKPRLRTTTVRMEMVKTARQDFRRSGLIKHRDLRRYYAPMAAASPKR